MKRVLLVDDDPVILGLYQKPLAQRGFAVETADDGLGAVKALRANRPDALVLDLMMPKFSGVDVLRFVRAEARLRDLPVVVLTNAYSNDLSNQALRAGVQQSLLKVRCTPTILAAAIDDAIVSGTQIETESAGPTQEPASLSGAAARSSPPAPPAVTVAPANPEPDKQTSIARQNLILTAARTRNEFQTLAFEFLRTEAGSHRDLQLQSLCRRSGFLGATAGLAGCHGLALLASAFEALLFELIHRPELITPSAQRTVLNTTDLIGEFLESPSHLLALPPPVSQVLVTDDDPLYNRVTTAALRRVQLNARSTEDPVTALRWARETRFDLCLLDIEMPGLNGFELCEQIRALPGYQRVPVTFVTCHGDAVSQSKSVRSGANDLIPKPVQPVELAVKAVTHLLRSLVQEQPAT